MIFRRHSKPHGADVSETEKTRQGAPVCKQSETKELHATWIISCTVT
jgi:hypothetical protein